MARKKSPQNSSELTNKDNLPDSSTEDLFNLEFEAKELPADSQSQTTKPTKYSKSIYQAMANDNSAAAKQTINSAANYPEAAQIVPIISRAAADDIPRHASTSLPNQALSQPEPLTKVLTRLKNMVENNFAAVWLTGEVSQAKVWPSGHLYMTLKDGDDTLSTVVWKSVLARVKYLPQAGEVVEVKGLISIYKARSECQLIANSFRQADSQGAIRKQLELLKAKLNSEGLFDKSRKQELPAFPLTIGVVTSAKGAALADILTILRRRSPWVKVILSPCLVQGVSAPADIVLALKRLCSVGCDVAIVGRGGGSVDDLSAFNNETVVRTIAALPFPVVSAVGHEIDLSLADMVADARAATPSEAAELIAPDGEQLRIQVELLKRRCLRAIQRHCDALRNYLRQLTNRHAFRDPKTALLLAKTQKLQMLRMRYGEIASKLLQPRQQIINLQLRYQQIGREFSRYQLKIQECETRLVQAIKLFQSQKRQAMRLTAVKLEAISPLAVLSRGYSVTLCRNQAVLNAADLQAGDTITTILNCGQVQSTVTQIVDKQR